MADLQTTIENLKDTIEDNKNEIAYLTAQIDSYDNLVHRAFVILTKDMPESDKLTKWVTMCHELNIEA